jgi:hypothetical protein
MFSITPKKHMLTRPADLIFCTCCTTIVQQLQSYATVRRLAVKFLTDAEGGRQAPPRPPRVRVGRVRKGASLLCYSRISALFHRRLKSLVLYRGKQTGECWIVEGFHRRLLISWSWVRAPLFTPTRTPVQTGGVVKVAQLVERVQMSPDHVTPFFLLFVHACRDEYLC